MKVVIVANVEQRQELLLKKTNANVVFVFVNTISEIYTYADADIFFILTEESFDPQLDIFVDKPVFINSVIESANEKKYPTNFSRINGWPGFLQRQLWEVASNNTALASKAFEHLGWNSVFVKDEPGLVAARIISMIINEAFFAVDEKVSTSAEIDLAMKLGTNYPYGPFEWLDKIGLERVYKLLKRLSASAKRYSVSPLLEKKYSELVSSQ